MRKYSFAEYMQHALYAPNTGYYTKPNAHIGRSGDFITAPLLTPLFGQTLAQQIIEVFAGLNTTSQAIFEFGAGTGKLCIDMLQALDAADKLPCAYHILELSPSLKAEQHEAIQRAIPHLLPRIIWHDKLPDTPIEGVVIANEILDAMPVHRFLKKDAQLFESMVTQNEAGEYIEHFEPCENQALLQYVARYISHNVSPYASEANLFIDGWLKACFDILKRGVVLLIDYGFPAHEYYHQDRATGTLMCHYQHTAHTNPFAHPSDEDITAHVNFTHVAEAALDAGFEVLGYTTQAAFLLSLGLLSLLEVKLNTPSITEKEKIQLTQPIKQLLEPHEMGELFKVMALGKAFELPLTGFQRHDKRASLDP